MKKLTVKTTPVERKKINVSTATEEEIRAELVTKFGWIVETEFHPYLSKDITYYSHPIHTFDPIKGTFRVQRNPIGFSMDSAFQSFPFGYAFVSLEEMDDKTWIAVARIDGIPGPNDRIFARADNCVLAMFRVSLMCWNDKEKKNAKN